MADTPMYDPKTGELLDDDSEQVRPFAEMLTVLRDGATHAEASRGLHDLIAAVQATGKKGGITIAIEVSPLKGSTTQVMVTAQVGMKLPKGDPAAGVFYVDDAGNLSRKDPRQLELEGLRVVEPKPAARVIPAN